MAERKLAVLLIGCHRLPPQQATGTNHTQVCFRMIEKHYTSDGARSSLITVGSSSVYNMPQLPKRADVVGEGGPLQNDDMMHMYAMMYAAAGDDHLPTIIDAENSSTRFTALGGGDTPASAPLGSTAIPPTTSRRVEKYLGPGAQRSSVVRYTGDPMFDEMFVFEELPIPYFYTSEVAKGGMMAELGGVHEHGGYLQLTAAQADNGAKPRIVASPREKKDPADVLRAQLSGSHTDASITDRRYFLEIQVRDVTHVGDFGDLVASAELQVDTLPMTQRTEMWLQLCPNRSNKSIAFPPLLRVPYQREGDDEVHYIEQEDPEQLPEIGLVIEPINFGVVPQRAVSSSVATASAMTRRNSRGGVVILSSTQSAMWTLVKDELAYTFSNMLTEFIFEIFTILDEQLKAPGLGIPEMHAFLQELYTATGTPLPTDATLTDELKYLFATLDRNHDDLLTVQEACMLLRASQWRVNLGPRWRPQPGAATSRDASSPTAASSSGTLAVDRDRPLVDAATVAGCLWVGEIPLPFTYAGFRRPNGRVHDHSTRPKAPPDMEPYGVQKYHDRFDELYGHETKPQRSEETGRIVGGPPEELTEDERHRAALADGATIPLFERRRPLDAPFEAKSEAQKQRERDALARIFSPERVLRPEDPRLPSTAGENISSKAIGSVFLNCCVAENCIIVGCRIAGGTYTNCTFESCFFTAGACVVSARALRSCRAENTKICTSAVFNGSLLRCTLDGCPYVAQTSLRSCTVRSASLFHCYVQDMTLDVTVHDGGANLFEQCSTQEFAKMTYAERHLDL